MSHPDVQGGDFPSIPSPVFRTEAGTPYLTRPGIHLIARPQIAPDALSAYLHGFNPEAHLTDALTDPVVLPPGAALCKTAGQLCYMSFGPKRTPNAQAARYFQNILESGHGSVLEHASYSFLMYGVSRSVTHELVRHRAGFAFSQVSQRYVSGQVLRFVERPEFQDGGRLHQQFVERIDQIARAYTALQDELSRLQQAGEGRLSAQRATERRKRVQQAARALLPNETEAPIVVTANVRAWRQFIEARASQHADIEIRILAWYVLRCLRQVEPLLFGDYDETPLPDGTVAVSTATPKV